MKALHDDGYRRLGARPMATGTYPPLRVSGSAGMLSL